MAVAEAPFVEAGVVDAFEGVGAAATAGAVGKVTLKGGSGMSPPELLITRTCRWANYRRREIFR